MSRKDGDGRPSWVAMAHRNPDGWPSPGPVRATAPAVVRRPRVVLAGPLCEACFTYFDPLLPFFAELT